MRYLERKKILHIIFCTFVLMDHNSLFARRDLLAEEKYENFGGRLSLTPQFNSEDIGYLLEGRNIIGPSDQCFSINQIEREWEKDKPEGKTSQSKYSLAGIALFSGKDPVSCAIKAITGSKISHVGLILSDTDNAR